MKDKKKIIIIVSSPFYLRDYNRFGIEKFLKNGYEIEICNTCPIIYPVFFKKAQRANLYRGKIEKIFFNKKKLKNYLNLNKKNIFILTIHYNIKTHFIFKLITKLDINYLFSLVNVVPSNIEVNKNINYKIILSLKALTRIFSNRIIGFLKKYFQKIKSPSYLLAGGLKSLKSPQASIINNSTKIIWAHTYDYEDYLLNNKKKNNNTIHAIKNNFAVFIDAPSPLIKHDALIPGISSPLTANVYFPSLCKFFDKIEKRLNIEVIIAAHPRSNHLNRPEYFGKRRVFKHMTIDLIKKCKLVINRNSTAINYAVLYSKPIIFHTSKQISNDFSMTHQIYSMANLLDKVPINIDALENVDWNNQLNINKKLYENYSNQYIKNPESKKKYLWDIVINEINNEKTK